MVQPAVIGPVIAADPDDDAVLAAAVGAQAQAVVSGDPHLLQLGQYQGIAMWPPGQVLVQMAP